jgi:biopolymer transport protein ExbB
MAHRVEVERLRRNVGTFRRIAVLAPLLGLLGTLLAVGRVLDTLPQAGSDQAVGSMPASWGPALAGSLGPLTLGVAIATLAIVIYDALSIRIERLSGALDRLGAETIDAIVMATPAPSPAMFRPETAHDHAPEPHTQVSSRVSGSGAGRTPHQGPSRRLHSVEPQQRHIPGDHDIGF